MLQDGYRTTDVARITGFSVRQIDYWAREGIIVPHTQKASGQGTRRLYDFVNLVQFSLIQRLKKAGWSTQKIRKAVFQLRTIMDDSDPLRNAVLMDKNGSLLALCKTKKGEHILLDALNPSGQQVMFIVLEELELETRKTLEFSTKYQGKASKQVDGPLKKAV